MIKKLILLATLTSISACDLYGSGGGQSSYGSAKSTASNYTY